MVRRTTPAASWSFTSRSFDTISSILAIASLRAARFSLGNSGGKPTIRRFYRLRRTNRLAGMPCTAISTGRPDALPLPGSRTMAAAQAESAGVRPVRPTATSGRYASPRMARGRSFPRPAGWRTGPGRGGHRARAGGPAAPCSAANLAAHRLDVVAVALPDVPEGLHADGQLASSHGHGSWSPAHIVVSAGCAPWRVGRCPSEKQQPAEAPPATEGEPPRPGQSVSRVTPVSARSSCRASSSRGSEGCAASRGATSTRSRITIIRRAVRFRGRGELGRCRPTSTHRLPTMSNRPRRPRR